MERAYSAFRSVKVASGDEEDQLIARVIALYDDISKRYPMASIPHYRCSVLEGRRGQADSALNAAKTALSLLNKDPYLFGRKGHFISSTIPRRVSYLLSQEAEELARTAGEDGKLNQETERRCISLLMEAFRCIFANLEEPTDEISAYFSQIEYRRRLNNIVFTVVKILETSDSDWALLKKEGLDEAGFRELLAKLHPHGIDQVQEFPICHTIGAAYYVLGEARLAKEAAEQLKYLCEHEPADTSVEDIDLAMGEIDRWLDSVQAG